MAEGDIDLDFDQQQDQVNLQATFHSIENGSDGEVDELEDGEVKDDDEEEENGTKSSATPSPPFPHPSLQLEPGEAPFTPAEMEFERERMRRPSMDGPPPPDFHHFEPQGPGLFPPPPHMGYGEPWGREGEMPPMSPTHLILCKFYARGDCAYGDTCRFAHPPGFVPRPPFPGRGMRPMGMRGGYGPRMPLPMYGVRHPPPQPQPPPRPPPAPPVEGDESWEAGLQKAKELLKKSGKLNERGKTPEVRSKTKSPRADEPISDSDHSGGRVKTPPTPDPETYYGLHHGQAFHAQPPRRRCQTGDEELVVPPPRPPVPLSYRPRQEEYETYRPPPRQESPGPPGRRPPFSPPYSPRSGHNFPFDSDYYDGPPMSRKRELPPPPKERNQGHPPPKIFKGTSRGPAQRRFSRSPPARSPPRRQRSSRERESMERRSRERELRKEAARRELEARRSTSGSGHRSGHSRERERPLPYSRSRSPGDVDEHHAHHAHGPKASVSEPAGWQDPWERRSRKDQRRSRRSSSDDSSRSGSRPGSRTNVKQKSRSGRSASLDSVSSVESYDSQKHGPRKSSPVINQKSLTVKNPTGKLSDLLRANSEAEGKVREEKREEDGEDEEEKERRREHLLQQLHAVETQIAKKRSK